MLTKWEITKIWCTFCNLTLSRVLRLQFILIRIKPALSEMTVDEIKNISSLQKEVHVDGTNAMI